MPATLSAMRLLVQAIVTGFGLKLGADIYKYVKAKLGLPDEKDGEELAPEAAGSN